MFKFFNNWHERRIIKRSNITALEWDKAFTVLPLLDHLRSDEKKRLQELVILFLNEKIFEGAHDLRITQAMRLIIALQACLPILKFGIGDYSGWTSVIVYPSGYTTKNLMTDEYGIEHQVQSNLAGEAWLRGPVILAWDATEHAGIIDGSNLVIHEFAHKLDMQNGIANGYPPLHSNMLPAAWVKAFGSSFEDFKHRCSHNKNIGIDCYGASSPAEFFAVLSEVFFECPDIIIQHYPDIYEQLSLYYRQDTLSRLK